MHGYAVRDDTTVRYQQSTLNVDGALLFKLFDGTITVQDLRARESAEQGAAVDG